MESVSFCPAKGRFAAGGEDMWVHLYDYATGEELECNKGARPPAYSTRVPPLLMHASARTLRGQAPLHELTRPDSQAYREGLSACGRTCPGQPTGPGPGAPLAPGPAASGQSQELHAADGHAPGTVASGWTQDTHAAGEPGDFSWHADRHACAACAAPAQATTAPCRRCALRRTARRMRRAPRTAPSGSGAPTGRAPRTASRTARPMARERRVALSSGHELLCEGRGRLCGACVHIPGTAAGGAKSGAVPGSTLFVWRGVLRRSPCCAKGPVRSAVACFATAWFVGDACRSHTLRNLVAVQAQTAVRRCRASSLLRAVACAALVLRAMCGQLRTC